MTGSLVSGGGSRRTTGIIIRRPRVAAVVSSDRGSHRPHRMLRFDDISSHIFACYPTFLFLLSSSNALDSPSTTNTEKVPKNITQVTICLGDRAMSMNLDDFGDLTPSATASWWDLVLHTPVRPLRVAELVSGETTQSDSMDLERACGRRCP